MIVLGRVLEGFSEEMTCELIIEWESSKKPAECTLEQCCYVLVEHEVNLVVADPD